MSGGEKLKKLRERLGMTLRDIEEASNRLGKTHGNPEFCIPASRLSDIEAKGMVPSLYRLYSLAVIYRTDLRELLGYFGIDVTQFAADLGVAHPQVTHLIPASPAGQQVRMPTAMDAGFDPHRTRDLFRMIEDWGTVPLSFLEHLEKSKYFYAFLGRSDLTMHPLLLPGSFLQIDPERNIIQQNGAWRSEHERPIYFFETREGYLCSWCSKEGGQIIIQPHPLSPVHPRLFKHPHEIEVVGQVVGVAMRLEGFLESETKPESKERAANTQNVLKMFG
jgi:transcriptional regulator with XRE-family HTH domain